MSIVNVPVTAAMNEIKLFSKASAPMLQGCLINSPGLLTKVIGMTLNKVQNWVLNSLAATKLFKI